MPSFDVVSKTDISEVDNALNGVAREVKQRYDLKERMCSIERSGNSLTITADNQTLLRQMHELLHIYCVRRGVDNRVMDFKPDDHKAEEGQQAADEVTRRSAGESQYRSDEENGRNDG